MKAISLWQPWASAIALGLKCVETRSWSTSYRGPLAIHAAKTTESADFIFHPEAAPYFRRAGILRETQLPFGCVVAVCELTRCLPTEELLSREMVDAMEIIFGGYDAGRFGWVLEGIRPLTTPLPWKGSQGFFEVPDSLLGLPPANLALHP